MIVFLQPLLSLFSFFSTLGLFSIPLAKHSPPCAPGEVRFDSMFGGNYPGQSHRATSSAWLSRSPRTRAGVNPSGVNWATCRVLRAFGRASPGGGEGCARSACEGSGGTTKTGMRGGPRDSATPTCLRMPRRLTICLHFQRSGLQGR